MNEHPIKTTLDVGAVATAFGTVAGWMPAIAALFTIIWTGIRIWESETIRKWRT